jgi:hypothetical protein
MEITRIETADVEALEHRVREIRHGLITFDGCMLAGKTGLMREIARRLGAQGLDLDDFVDRQQGVFVEALRLQELTAAIEQAHAKTGVVLLSGICMLEVLERIGRDTITTNTASPYTSSASPRRSPAGASRAVAALARPAGFSNERSPGCTTSSDCEFASRDSQSFMKPS